MRIKALHRFEFKYLVNRDQTDEIAQQLLTRMVPDAHYQGHPYRVTSLYYDSGDYKAYWDKLEGLRFRRKVRVRVYNAAAVSPETLCFVEIKQHLNKTISKKRVTLPYAAADALCSSGQSVPDVAEADRAVVEELQYLSDVQQLQPACVISYDRLAFNGTEYDPGLRVTFDTNLKGRIHDLSLLSQGFAGDQFFVPPHQFVMEVKVNYHIPQWLVELIGVNHLTLRSVSKYCAALENSKAVLQRRQVTYLKEGHKRDRRIFGFIFKR